jgi:hypothetical protein
MGHRRGRQTAAECSSVGVTTPTLWRLARLGADGGAPQPTSLVNDDDFGTINVTADGSSLLFNMRLHPNETKVLDNVLSAVK